jgi:nanoRNase/pAp phosphatase (c-di-AMP/oligoRNAs hydrolase)
VDVAALAGQFSGGGHHRAAGASLAGSMAEVEEKVLTAARAFLLDRQPA